MAAPLPGPAVVEPIAATGPASPVPYAAVVGLLVPVVMVLIVVQAIGMLVDVVPTAGDLLRRTPTLWHVLTAPAGSGSAGTDPRVGSLRRQLRTVPLAGLFAVCAAGALHLSGAEPGVVGGILSGWVLFAVVQLLTMPLELTPIPPLLTTALWMWLVVSLATSFVLLTELASVLPWAVDPASLYVAVFTVLYQKGAAVVVRTGAR